MAHAAKHSPAAVHKVPTGIAGLDQVTNGGLPRGRNTLICGGAGAGKTLFAMEFLLRGAKQFGEPGVCLAFEETSDEISTNMASLGYDVPALVRARKLAIDHVQVKREQIEETGEYDLEPLLIRLRHAIQSIKAKRVVLDTLEVLFSGLRNEAIVRAELRRIFNWLKDLGVTSVITAETGITTLTRHGLEEYVADCVIRLEHRADEQSATRRLRVVKYRGSAHSSNEFPFLVGEQGLSVVPITSLGLSHAASTDRIPSGIAGLDEMLDGKGFYRGSSVLVTGTAGTGKSSFLSAFADAACARGERCLYFAFEESPSQILRNMASVGIDLKPWMNKKLLQVHAARPTSMGLEAHLIEMHRAIDEREPTVVLMDPITNLISVGDVFSVKAMLTRIIDYLKVRGITGMFSNLTIGDTLEETAIGISSLMDTWILLRDVKEDHANRHRFIEILKSRGMAHSAESRRFTLGDRGIQVLGPQQKVGRKN